jgi:hypothetical protein
MIRRLCYWIVGNAVPAHDPSSSGSMFFVGQDTVRPLHLKLLICLVLLALAGNTARAEFITAQETNPSSQPPETRVDQGEQSNPAFQPGRNDIVFRFEDVVFQSPEGATPSPLVRIPPRQQNLAQEGLGASGSTPGAGAGSAPVVLGFGLAVPPAEFAGLLFTGETGNAGTPCLAGIFHPPRVKG